MDKDKKVFENYIKQMVQITFGFEPVVEVEILSPGVVTVTLDGTPTERADLMGKEANNFHCIKGLFRIFSRKCGYFSYLFIKRYK